MSNTGIATFGGGCFWCTEAIFQRLKGVIKVVPGYSGGDVDNPSYEQVSAGNTGHAEATQITFDPTIIGFDKLLEIFFATHDPTTLNRQGNDIGSQYRSAVFYHSDNQKKDAENCIKDLEKSGKFDIPIVTEVSPFRKFFPAEDYHKNYYNTHKDQAYCKLVIDPKVQKLMKEFSKEIAV
jgi:peptide-methionine (S)-S-oxide reductase